MLKVNGGWLAQTADARGFRVGGETPAGVFISATMRRVELHDAGLKNEQGTSFKMPSDPALLRDLAKCLEEAANYVAKRRGII